VNGSTQYANSSLKPEDGTHYNLFTQYDFLNGSARLELYHEDIRNAIYPQSIFLGCQNPALSGCPLSSLISSIGQVSTNGVDVSTNFKRVLDTPIDVQLNGNFVNATIVSNPDNPSIVGNQMPLMPHWRTNLLTTYHYGSDWDFTLGTRYNSQQYSQLDNKDNGNIYNYTAFTAAYYVDLKATYRFYKGAHFSAGVNNLNDYSAYFNHPLPQRSFFAQIGYKF
jgi:iron complex outermembrane receptor protein